jgi:hypothetical protein
VNLIAAQGKPTSSKELQEKLMKLQSLLIIGPSVNNRPIWGALVPFNQVWRAGANDATTFETDKDLILKVLNYQQVFFFVIPNEKNVSLFLIKKPNNGALTNIKIKKINCVLRLSHKLLKLQWRNWCIPSRKMLF